MRLFRRKKAELEDPYLLFTSEHNWGKKNKYLDYNKHQLQLIYKNCSKEMLKESEGISLKAIFTLPIFTDIHFTINPFSFEISSNHISVNLNYLDCKEIEIINRQNATSDVIYFVDFINKHIKGDLDVKDIFFSNNGKIRDKYKELAKIEEKIEPKNYD